MSTNRERVRYNGIMEIAKKDFNIKEKDVKCSIMIPKTKIRDQGETGRCWIEVGLDEIEYLCMLKSGNCVPSLSTNYIAYFDLKEKIRIFLEQIYSTKDVDISNFQINHWLSKPVQDAGQRVVLYKLLDKYGIIPEKYDLYSVSNKDTHALIAGINQKLRLCAFQIRNDNKKPDDVIDEVYLILDTVLAKPIESFEYEGKTVTPIEYYKEYIKPYIDEYISVINVPTETRPFNREFRVKWLLSNTEKGSEINYINISIDVFKEMIIRQLKENIPVWIGVDGEHFTDKMLGVFDTDMYDFNELFDISLDIKKGEAAVYKDSLMSHAMYLCGVDIKGEKIDHWCAKNSYGEECGQEGYVYISPEWFDRYVYQAVIKREIANDYLNIEDKSIIWLEAWDSIGCLA